MTIDFTAQVAKGAALLDKHRPGWAGQIDIRRLRMSAGEFHIETGGCGCILAQVDAHHMAHGGYGIYDSGINRLLAEAGLMNHRNYNVRYQESVNHGFTISSEMLLTHDTSACWAALSLAWKQAIKERLHA